MSVISDPLASLVFDQDGLIPVIAQDYQTHQVLMFAYMSQTSLRLSLESGYAVYWSRSRQRLWHKGEESGHRQKIHDLRLDCDGDVILIMIEQIGGIACHTGRASCFYQQYQANTGTWETIAPVLKDPDQIYK